LVLPLQLKALLHTPQEYGHSPQHMLLMNSNKQSPHFTANHFTYFHCNAQWFVHVFHSRTTFSPLITNGLWSG